MGKALDFDKIRRRRQRIVTVKRLLILAGVMILVGAGLFLNDLLVEESAMTSVRDYFESFGGAGFPADLPGGVIRGVMDIGGNLAVLNDTNLYIYNKKAKVIQNIQRMTDQTMAETSGSRVMTFAVGSKGFSVHSISREMFTHTLDFGIMCGTMNQSGDFAVVAPVKQFASKVYVYDRRFQQIYNWSSPEYVTDVSISPKGDMMAVNCVSGEGGVIESLIYIFRFSEQREKAEVALKLPDNLCMGLDFVEDEHIALLTDKQYMVLNSLGEIKNTYNFNGKRLLASETYGRQTLFLIQRRDGTESELVLLDENLKEASRLELDKKVVDMAVGKDIIYILTEDGITGLSHDMRQISEHEQRNISNIHLAGTRLYYLTADQICVLG